MPSEPSPSHPVRRRVLRPIVRRLMPGAVPPDDAAPQTESVVVGAAGDRITVTETGQGPAILLLHSGGSDGSSWAAVANLLAGRFRTLRFDRHLYRAGSAAAGPVPTGPTATDPHPTGPTATDAQPTGSAGAAAMARDVADVLAVAATVPGPLLLVGHSSGGVTALQAALADPGRFAGLLLYEPPLAVTEPLGGEALRRAHAALDAGDLDQAMIIHMRDIVHLPTALVGLMRLLPPLRVRLRRYAAAQIHDDEAIESLGVGIDRYAGLALPTLLLGGGRSPEHLRNRLGSLAAVLPGTPTVVIMPKRGHTATLSAPGEVAQVIAEFADRVLR